MLKNRKRTVVRTLALILCCLFILPVYGASSTKDKIKNKEAEIKALENKQKELANKQKTLKDKIANLQKEQASLKNYIETLDAELDGIVTELLGLEEDKIVKEQEIADTEEQLIAAQQKEAEQYAAMKVRIKYMYENGNDNFLALLFSSENLKDLLNHAEYIEKMTQYDRDKLDEFVATRESIEDFKAVLIAERESLEALIKVTEAAQENMEILIAAKNEDLLKYYAQIASSKEDQNELSALQKELDEAEEKMNSELEALEEQLKKEEAAKKIIYDGGQFIWPLKNYFKVTSDYGFRNHPLTHKWTLHNGIDIGAPTGTPIMAVYDGEVVTMSYTSSAGYFVMVNHGSGLYSVYMHCSKFVAKVGQKVKQGDTIALVGSTGSSTAPHLHFSVRLNGTYVNPGPYVGYNK